MLCIVTERPADPLMTPSVRYTEMGKAYLRAMAAKNISMQMRKFWYPAEITPAPTSTFLPSASQIGKM